ncbi:cytochrome B [Ekhidna sp.]
MYNFILQFHSGLRWLILVAIVIAVLKSLIGLFAGTEYSKFDKIVAVALVGMMHLQLLTGLILYFIYSPFITYNMSDKVSRFWSVEHLALMLFAVVAAQVGRSISKKTQDAQVKFRFQSIFFGMALVLMILGIPWNRI